MARRNLCSHVQAVSYFFSPSTRCRPNALAPFFCVVTHHMARNHTGNHTRHTPTGLALATPSPMRSADTRNRLATEVAPDTPGTHPRFRSLPPTPSDSGGILPSSTHTTYWGYLSQADTHLPALLTKISRSPSSFATDQLPRERP